MGDGNIQWNPENEKLTLAELHSMEKHENYYDTPRSLRSIDGDECTTPSSPTNVVLEELHRNTNHSLNTPDLSNVSSGNPTVERPAAGEIQNNPQRNGRRNFRPDAHNADNAFGLPLGPAAGLGPQETGQSAADGIFSVRGTRSVKINRHRDSVSVFPSGCMGVTDVEEEVLAIPVESEEPATVMEEPATEMEEPAAEMEETEPEIVAPEPVSPPSHHSQVVKPAVQSLSAHPPAAQYRAAKSPAVKSPVAKSPAAKSPVSPQRAAFQSLKPPIPDTVKPVAYTSSRGTFRPNSAARNPLTGEGYADKDIRRHFVVKKPDGNPLLGQGYDDAKGSRPKHVPPGGYSKGLW